MAIKQNNYWKKRFESIESTSNAYAQDVYRQIEPAFTQAQREIQDKIDTWYTRIAVNNQVSISQARKLLSTKELAEFKWSVKEFIKYGEDNAINPIWMKQLENASAKYHISRLEALKIQTQQSMEKAFGNELDDIDVMAKRVYTDDYYHSAYEIQRGLNVGWGVSKVDVRRLEKLISKPWASDGKNFSDRIWQSKTSMVNELHNELVRTCILGKSPDEAIRHMTKFVDKKFSNAKMQAGRLVMTEQAFFASAAQQDCFNELDVEEFEVVATLDSLTSAICQELDGKHFHMKDYQPGVTAPPFHVWCRSTTVPFFDDEWETGERVARGEDGKTYYVPESMKYDEWKQKFVDGDSKDGLKLTTGSGIMKDKQKDEWVGLDYTPSYNKSDAIDRLKTEYGIQFTDSKKYPMNGELLGDCVSWMDSFSKQYPAFMKNNPCKIPTIVNQAPSKMKNAVGYYSYYSNGKVVELALNGKYHSDAKFFEEYVKKCVSIKWYPENSTIHKTFVHEFGHHVSNSMKTILSKPNWEHEFVSACITDFKRQVPEYQYNTCVGMSDYVSRYGASSQSELFAEAFAEYFGGENPRLFAKILGGKLETLLKEVK